MAALETHLTRTAFGALFWDQATNTAVRDALSVVLTPATQPERRSQAFVTPNGVYAFQGLPGLRTWEYSGALQDASPPIQLPFILEVTDARGRFLPLAMTVDLPWIESGLFLSSLRSTQDPDDPPGFYLFSAPTRRSDASMARLTGQLWDAAADRPATHARIEVTLDQDGNEWHGLTDGRGCVGLVLPYPSPEIAAGSPPVPVAPALRTWGLTLRVRYAGVELERLDGTGLPDFREVARQPYALVQADRSSAPAAAAAFTLSFGRDLVLRTDDLPRLWISPAASPPIS